MQSPASTLDMCSCVFVCVVDVPALVVVSSPPIQTHHANSRASQCGAKRFGFSLQRKAQINGRENRAKLREKNAKIRRTQLISSVCLD